MNLWYNPHYPQQVENIEEFSKMMRQYPNFTWMHPNYKSSPWHLVAICGHTGVSVSFWPHLMKGHLEGEASSRVGLKECKELLRLAEIGPEDFDLVEDFTHE